MSEFASISASQSVAACRHARAGAFVLAPAQALALRPTETSSLRITCGRAWVTLGDGKDYFLQEGQSLQACRGSAVVIEPMHTAGIAHDTEMLFFDWDPVPVKVPKMIQHLCMPMQSSPQQKALAQAWGDFCLALTAGFLAGARLAGALLGLLLPAALRASLGLTALARNAHSSASRAQGRMASCESIASSGAV